MEQPNSAEIGTDKSDRDKHELENSSCSHNSKHKHYKLISYSLSGLDNVSKIQVSRRVNGYTSRKKIKGKTKTKEYKYPGLKNENGVILVSDSTLLIPDNELANGFTEFLTRKLVNYTKMKVLLE